MMRSFRRQFWGLVLILLGVLALIQMSGFHLGLSFWPVVWLVLGLSALWHGLKRTSWFSIAFGLWLGGIGLFDILHDAGLTAITGRNIAAAAWPLVLVALGLGLLLGKNRWVHGFDVRFDRHGSHIVGDLRYGNSAWTLDQDLTLDHGVGDVKVDLTSADITPGVHNIHVGAWIGEIVIRVPDNVTVFVDATANLGELEVLGDRRDGVGLSVSKQIVVDDSPAELHIQTNLGIGSLRVTQRPPIVRFVP